MWNPFKNSAKHQLTAEEQELGRQRREMNKRIENLKLAQTEEIMQKRHEVEMAKLDCELDKYSDDPAEEIESAAKDPDSMINNMMMMAMINMMGKNGASPVPFANNPPAPVGFIPPHHPPVLPPTDAGVSISDEEIKIFWEKMPKHHKILAKAAPDGVIAAKIRETIPNIDDDSVQRAINFVRSQ